MDIFNTEDFKTLAAVSPGPCISIYLRMFDKGKETRQNAIRFKNALSDLKAALEKLPGDTSEVRSRLEPIGALLDDGAFWRNQSQGLAVFACPGISRVYRLPLGFEDLQIVAGRFHLKPVLPLISENLRFYILAISQNSTRFFRCDRLHIDPVAVDKMPKDIDDALGYELEQRQFQFYTGAPVERGTTRRSAVFHGQGFPANEMNDRLLRYCRQIDAAVFEVLRNEAAPLVLAGVDKLLAIYKEATGYHNVKGTSIIGNHEHSSDADMHRQAWQVASSDLDERRQKAIEKYNTLKGTGLAVADVPSIVSCAFDGRVDRLILGAGLHVWGKCDGTGRNVEIHSDRKQAPDVLDLLDVAACETILKGGEVWTVDPAQMQENSVPAAATLRF
ncbi:MAG: hypothetical protein C4519_19770 [Desulfobacteraceae bacterium]|nr:MAG: hypothetical protein C4519_19770 [Desulfobacteraceae bacterium]